METLTFAQVFVAVVMANMLTAVFVYAVVKGHLIEKKTGVAPSRYLWIVLGCSVVLIVSGLGASAP